MKHIWSEMSQNIKNSFTLKTVIGVLLGNVIIGIAIAILRVSNMGNDPYTAMNMAVSESIGMGLGTYQIILNLVFLVVQLIWGRKYIGLGTIINMFLLGYVVQYMIPIIEAVIGKEGSHEFVVKLVIMAVALVVLACGLAIYQSAHSGVAPYDYLSLGMTEVLSTPYFLNRVFTDIGCVLISLSTFLLGFQDFAGCHLGIGTLMTALCLGPLVAMFNKVVKPFFNK